MDSSRSGPKHRQGGCRHMAHSRTQPIPAHARRRPRTGVFRAVVAGPANVARSSARRPCRSCTKIPGARSFPASRTRLPLPSRAPAPGEAGSSSDTSEDSRSRAQGPLPALPGMARGASRLGERHLRCAPAGRMRPGEAPAPGPVSHLTLGRPRCSRTARTPPASFTYASTCCLHASCMRTRRRRTSCGATRPSPFAVSSFFIRSLLAAASSPALASCVPA